MGRQKSPLYTVKRYVLKSLYFCLEKIGPEEVIGREERLLYFYSINIKSLYRG